MFGYVRLATAFIDESVDATVLHGSFVAVEGVSGQAHNLAGSGDIREFFSEIEQSDLVFYDALVTM